MKHQERQELDAVGKSRLRRCRFGCLFSFGFGAAGWGDVRAGARSSAIGSSREESHPSIRCGMRMTASKSQWPTRRLKRAWKSCCGR